MNELAVVTGATGGIGSAISRRLSGAFRVVGVCRTTDGEAATEWITDAGPEAELVRADLMEHESTTAAIESLLERRGVPSVLVNCAGVTADALFSKMEFADWDRVLRTNLLSLFSVTQPIYRAMCERGGGSIINISSVNGERGQAGQVNYSASKAGIHGFTMALAREGGRHGVRVNTVSPGYTNTPMVSAMRDDVRQRVMNAVPLGRFADAGEIAGMVAFLASAGGAYATGANFSINGGLHIGY